MIISEVLFIIRLAMSGPYKKIEIYKKKMGISAGKNIRITGNVVFGTEPYLIELGNDITITRRDIDLTFGYKLNHYFKAFCGISP